MKLIVIISQILFYMSSKVIMAGGAYYSLYVLKDMDHMSWLMATFQGPSIITQFFTPFMMRRFGKNKVLITGTAFMIIGGSGMGIAAPHIPAMIIFNSLKSIGNGMYIGMLYGIVADIVSFTKRKTGVFAVGVSNAGVSAANKIGQGAGNLVLGFCMSLAGFDAALEVQSETVLTAISFGFIWIPVAAYSVIFVLFVLFFDLDKQMEKEVAA